MKIRLQTVIPPLKFCLRVVQSYCRKLSSKVWSCASNLSVKYFLNEYCIITPIKHPIVFLHQS